jgi:hypothetical protein
MRGLRERMTRTTSVVTGAALLAGPTLLAFFSGGYFTRPRVIAAIVVWLLVLGLAGTGLTLPRSVPGRMALAGLAALTGWSALSILWAPQAGPAVQNVQRLVLYAGTLLVATSALRDPRLRRAVEPALAAGATVVIGYGLSGQLLPGLVDLARSASAGGRLEQPLTYWNAEGALAAMGMVLCVRLAGDRSRPRAISLAAAAVAPALFTGVYLSYSRGALAAAVLGLVVLAAAAPSRAQLRAAALALAAGIVAAACSELLAGVSSLEASAHERSRDGALLLAVLIAAGAAMAWAIARARGEPEREPRWYGWLRPTAWAASVAVAAGLLVGGLSERPSDRELAEGAGAARLTTVASNRYEYWRVALDAFRDEPLTGVGSGGFRVVWLKERVIGETVRDTHSLLFEMAAELGVVGLLGFALMFGGGAVAARRALSRSPALAAGPVAALVVWSTHAMIDWDWEMPAETLPALVLAGFLVTLAEAETGPAGERRAGRAASSPRQPAAVDGDPLPPS